MDVATYRLNAHWGWFSEKNDVKTTEEGFCWEIYILDVIGK